MYKKFRKIEYVGLILCLVEIIGIVVISLLYIFNSLNFRNLLTVEHFAYISIGITIIDFLYIFIVLFYIHSKQQKNDINTVEIIGSDLQEAYSFGKIGFAITDDDDNVIWISDLLEINQVNLLNKNILQTIKETKQFINQNENYTIEVTIGNFIYQIRYLKRSHTYIFKDVTDFAKLSKSKVDEATCLGIILIDNYSDVVGTGEDNIDVITQVRSKILDYAKKYSFLVKSFRNDAYLVITSYKQLQRMVEDHFSLLNEVRELGLHEVIKPTLSIAIAHDFNDANKLMDMANQGIDLAMSRGGDQAVVLRFGADAEYFGGKTQSVEKRNKVKVRSIGDTLINLINQSSNVIVMGHKTMDMDAFGSCLGIKAICESFNKECDIIGSLADCENKVDLAINKTLKTSDLWISKKEADNKAKDKTLLIVVDVSLPRNVVYPEILDKCNKIIVIDHHRRAEDFIENTILSYIDTSASSASELIIEIIRYCSSSSQIKLNKTFATFMYSGILLDTNHFKSQSVGIRTFEACAILKEYGADTTKADDFLKDNFGEYKLVNEIVMTRVVYKTDSVWYCKSNGINQTATLAKAANQCMDFNELHAVFVIGQTGENEVRISARSDGVINVQLLCEKMGGGGHFGMAAAAFKDKTTDEVEKILLDTLDNYLDEATNNKAEE